MFVSPGSHGVRTHKSSLWKPVLWHMLHSLYRHKVSFAVTVERMWFFKGLFMCGRTWMWALESHFTLHCFTWMVYFPWDCRKCSEGLCVLWWKATVIYNDTDVLIHYTQWYKSPEGWLIICSVFFLFFSSSCCNAKNCSVRFLFCLPFWKYQLRPACLSLLFAMQQNYWS